jgi:hypothetical protein
MKSYKMSNDKQKAVQIVSKLPNAPLARAESIDLETKRLQLSVKQANNDAVRNKSSETLLIRNHGNTGPTTQGKPGKISLNLEDIDMKISLSPLSLSITKTSPDHKTNGKSKPSTQTINDEYNENRSTSPDKSVNNDADDDGDGKGQNKSKSHKLKRKKSSLKLKPQMTERNNEKGSDDKSNKSLDDLVTSSYENTQTSSKADDSDGCSPSSNPNKTSPAGKNLFG